jgi:hypothetical protein
MSQAKIRQIMKQIDSKIESLIGTDGQDTKTLRRLYKKQVKNDIRDVLSHEIPKGKSKKKHPDSPKRPKSAFMCFQDAKRKSAIESLNKKNNNGLNPGDEGYVDYRTKPTEVTRFLGQQWRKLKEKSPESLKKYEEVAQKDKVRYEQEKKEWEASLEVVEEVDTV